MATENKKPEEEITPEPKVSNTEGLNSFASALDEAIANSQKATAPLEEPEKKDPPKEEALPKEKAEEQKPEPEKEEHHGDSKTEPDDQDGEKEEGEEEKGPELPGLDDDDSEEPEETPKQGKEAKETPEEEDDSSYDPPRLKKRIERAKEKATREAEERYKTELEKARREKLELEAKLQQKQTEQPKADPLTDSEKEELLMLRRRLQAEKDPEIKKNFDDRIEDNRSTVNEIIKSSFPAKEDQDKLSQLGDFVEFASNPANAKYAQGIINEIAKNDPIRARQIEMRIADNEILKRGKQRQIEEMSKSAREWFEQQSQQENQQSAEYQKQVQERVQYVQGTLDKQLSHESLQPLPTDGLEGDNLKRVQEQNSTRKKMRDFIQGVRDQKIGNRVDDGINIAIAAAKSIGYRDELKRKDAEIKALRSKLEDRKQAGSVTKGNRATAPTQRREAKPQPDPNRNWIDTIDEQARQLAAGRE